MHTSTSNVSSSIRTQQQQNNMIQKDNTMKNISSTTLSLSSSTFFSHVRVVVRVRPKLTSEQNHSTTFLQVQPQT
jgi:hypothetical protein